MTGSFENNITRLIIQGDVEEALERLSEKFMVTTPEIRVGTVKGHRKAYAVYSQSDKTIYASKREALINPMIILHEFYHHLQSELYGKKGNEKQADKFAKAFISGLHNP